VGEAFDELVEVWREVAPATINPVKSQRAFDVAISTRDPAQIVAAAKLYLADAGRASRPKIAPLHLWLADACCDVWISLGMAAPPTKPAPPRFAGPATIREAVIAERGEGFAASYLDPAAWDADRRTIVTSNSLAGDQLRRLGLRFLEAVGVDAIEKIGG
jgi:hypothetical protein